MLTNTMKIDDISEIDDIRKKFGRFRVLIIGRANSGKTTILKKICNSTEGPEIYDDKGNRVGSYTGHFSSNAKLWVAIRSIMHGSKDLQGWVPVAPY